MIPLLSPGERRSLVNIGFTWVVVVSGTKSVRSQGAVEACFRNRGDAQKLITALNRIYGKGHYESMML